MHLNAQCSRRTTDACGDDTIQYNAVLSYTPYVAYSQTIRRLGKNIYVAKE